MDNINNNQINNNPPDDFVVLIISHGRANNIKTIKSLSESGYTGPVKILVDNEDSMLREYINNFGDKVIVFSKSDAEKVCGFDVMDNFTYLPKASALWARNIAFDVVKSIGYTYFWVLDDDYVEFRFNQSIKHGFIHKKIRHLNAVLNELLAFYKSIPNLLSLAIAQSGDFIGGCYAHNDIDTKRKIMNTFICSTERPFLFYGRFNEDVNAYTILGNKGCFFLTINQVGISQIQTQANKGGTTTLYNMSGTYVKSFYSVIGTPSSVKISELHDAYARVHHYVEWNSTCSKIIPESYRRSG